MIMKANKQIGFIYKNNESIDKILKDGNVVFERGFLREKVSTTLPITFGGVGKDLKDYKIYGNTYQNSTSGKNLYNINDMKTITSPAIINGEIIEISYDNTSGKTKYIEFHANISSLITENEKYSIICEILEINGAGALRLNSLNNNLNQSQFSVPSSYNISNLTSGQILIDIVTALSNFENALCCIRSNIRLEAGQSCSVKLRMSLIKGIVSENNFSYEPYTGGHPSPNPDYPQEIISCGDRTKNLFDKDTTNVLNAYFDSSHINITADTTNKVIYLPCKPSTTYSITQGASSLSNHLLQIGTTNTKPEIGTTTYSFEDHRNDLTFTYITNSTAKYIIIRLRNGDYTDSTYMSTVQLEEGSTATSYEPYGYKIPVNVNNVITNIYLDEPLRKIDEYSDYIDFINGKVVRKIGEIVLNGSENWGKSSKTSVNRYYLMKVILVNYDKNTIDLISDYFKCISPQSSDNDSIGLAKYNANGFMINFELTDTNFDTLSKFTTWLQSNNTTVDYVLSTPTEEAITLPNIPTIDGNNTLNIETEITPSQVYIKYKSNT